MEAPGTRDLSYVNQADAISARLTDAMCTGTGTKASLVQKGIAAHVRFVYPEAAEASTDAHAGFYMLIGQCFPSGRPVEDPAGGLCIIEQRKTCGGDRRSSFCRGSGLLSKSHMSMKSLWSYSTIKS